MLDRMMVASYIAALVCLCLIDALAASLKGVSLPRMCLGRSQDIRGQIAAFEDIMDHSREGGPSPKVSGLRQPAVHRDVDWNDRLREQSVSRTSTSS